MISTQGKGLVDRTVAEYVLAFVMGRRKDPRGNRSCGSFFCGAGTSLVAVSWDGGVFPCHKSIEEPRWRLLDLIPSSRDRDDDGGWEQGVDEYHHKGSFWFDCDSCSARSICTFSCSAFYVDGSGDEARECAFTKMFHRHLVEREAEVRDLAARLLSRRRPVSAEFPGQLDELDEPGGLDPERLLFGVERLTEFARDPGRRVLGWTPRGHLLEIEGRSYLLSNAPTRLHAVAPSVASALLEEAACGEDVALRRLAAEVGEAEASEAWQALPPVPKSTPVKRSS